MSDESPYEIMVYGPDYGFLGWVGGPISLTPTLRHNQLSTTQLVLDANHHRAGQLADIGARAVVYREGQFLTSGMVRLQGGEGPALESTVTFSIEDDFRLLHNTLAFPVPNHTLAADGTIEGQTVEYRSINGPAETVVKTIISENMARLGRTDVTVAPDLGRGKTGTYTFRMHPLYDRLFPKVEHAGLGVTVQQHNGGLVVDVYEPSTYPLTLSEESGTITGWSYSVAAPTNTRVIVGGQGEGTARTFKQYVGVNREAGWGDVIETLVDARDSDSAAVYDERADEALAEGDPISGLSLTLSETEHFRYGTPGVRVGDRVTAKVGNITVTDVLREASLTWAEDGEEVTPIVGERTDDPNRAIARKLRRLAAYDRDRKAR